MPPADNVKQGYERLESLNGAGQSTPWLVTCMFVGRQGVEKVQLQQATSIASRRTAWCAACGTGTTGAAARLPSRQKSDALRSAPQAHAHPDLTRRRAKTIRISHDASGEIRRSESDVCCACMGVRAGARARILEAMHVCFGGWYRGVRTTDCWGRWGPPRERFTCCLCSTHDCQERVHACACQCVFGVLGCKSGKKEAMYLAANGPSSALVCYAFCATSKQTRVTSRNAV